MRNGGVDECDYVPCFGKHLGRQGMADGEPGSRDKFGRIYLTHFVTGVCAGGARERGQCRRWTQR